MNLEELISNAKLNNKRLCDITKIISNRNYLLDELLNKTKFLNEHYHDISQSQRLYHIWFNEHDIKYCNICGELVKWSYKLYHEQYSDGNNYLQTCGKKDCKNKQAYLNSKDSIIKKYGKYFFQTLDFKDKSKKTCLEKYGEEYYLQTKKGQEKSKETCLEKYGVENVSQIKEIKERKKQTCLENFGVEWPLQSEEIFEKNQNSGHRKKSYIFPSGKEVKIQGYENYFLDEYFLNDGKEDDILTSVKDINDYLGIIYYNTPNGKKHRYYPDFYLINENKIIEVKSQWTLDKYKDINLLKQQTCLDKGLDFEFKIY